jgi:hypothetical protein
MRYLIVFVMAAVCVAMMSGCSDRFRYPCQDPDNWEKTECKPPLCSATATCPNDLVPPAKANQ